MVTGARNIPPTATSGRRGPGVVHRDPWQGPGFFSDLGLLRSLRGQRRRHSCLVPQPLATLSSRDASRSARRKRTGCVELYELVHPLARATGADRAPSRGRARRTSGVPIFQWETTFLGTEGRGGRRLTNGPYQVDRRGFNSRGCHFFRLIEKMENGKRRKVVYKIDSV